MKFFSSLLAGLLTITSLALLISDSQPVYAQTRPSDLTVKNENTSAGKPVLPAPQNLTVNLADNNSVILFWEEIPNRNLGEFIVLRSEDPEAALTPIAKVAANETTYLDTAVEVGKVYFYRVRSNGLDAVPGDSDVKSVLITNNIVPTVADNFSASDLTSLPISADFLSKDNFWLNVIAINSLLVGSLILLYSFFRAILTRSKKESALREEAPTNFAAVLANGKVKIDGNPNEVRNGLKLKSIEIDAKLGHKNVDILAEAKDTYATDRLKKLEEWEKAAK